MIDARKLILTLLISTALSGAHAETDAVTRETLTALLNAEHRAAVNVQRDQHRHPLETLTFFGIRADMTVVEMWPGSGRYYTELLAPLLRERGQYYAANFHVDEKSFDALPSVEYFAEKNAQRPDLYDRMIVTAFSDIHQSIAPPASADMVLTFRNVHNFTINGYVEDFFAAMYTALKPGGILGVVEHRGDPDVPQDPRGMSGYINQDYCIQLAEAAGFELVAASEINANPQDTKNYPEGVWTLPPTSRLKDTPENERYLAIGESDRMTLKFRKPVSARTDPMAPTSTAEGALTAPLHTVTLITPDWPELKKLLVDGMGLADSGPIPVDSNVTAQQRALWGMPADLSWTTRVLFRPGAPGTTQLRVLVTDTVTPSPRRSWSRQELGPYGMGFPTLDVFGWDEHLRALGFERATEEVEVFPVARPDGGAYPVHEAAFYGPEFLRVIAISRKGGMPQVGVYDAATNRGGPVYATQILEQADPMIEFLTQVLDLEVRSDRVWREYAVPFRFTLVHAKGSRTGHLALVEYDREHLEPPTGVPPRPPARGMVMWSFPVTDLDEILARAEGMGVAPLAGPAAYSSPALGQHRAATFIAPNGFLIEAFER